MTRTLFRCQADFNPRSPCGERHGSLRDSEAVYWISIHAPRVGSDTSGIIMSTTLEDFNPRSPCGERLDLGLSKLSRLEFQSTLPVWGATFNSGKVVITSLFQSTLPVWGATKSYELISFSFIFQSTLPVWGATVCLWRGCDES